MFAASSHDYEAASLQAVHQLKAWEKALALRVSLQKPLDTSGALPISEQDGQVDETADSLSTSLKKHMIDLTNVLYESQQLSGELQVPASRKRKNENACAMDDSFDDLWEKATKVQATLQREKWEPVLNKWHARLNFGSENTKAKLKVFTQTLWSQVENTLEDEQRSISKSRLAMSESRRLDRPVQDAAASAGEAFDLEVYDDRMFYAMLLKTFITTSAASSGAGEGAGLAGAMRAGDLEALRQYKRKKLNVERKASKGRKVRYNVHDKLQNFMFPMGLSGADAAGGMDSEKLFQSLFQ